MAEAEERSHGFPSFFLNLFPFLKPKPSTSDVKDPKPTAVSSGEDPQNSTSSVVSFPYTPPTIEEPLATEADVSSGRTSNSVVIWQVYALGGFLVLKWVWARWNERKERSEKKETKDDEQEQPSHGDDDEHVED